MLQKIKGKLVSILIIVITIILIPNTIQSAYANTLENHKEVMKITESKKQWTISFNEEVDSSLITENNVYIEDEHDNIIQSKITILSNTKSIVVEPQKSYEKEKLYYLCISNNIQSINGEKLKKDVRMPFIFEEAVIEKPSLSPENIEVSLSYEGVDNEKKVMFPRWSKTINTYMIDNKDGTIGIIEYNPMKKIVFVEIYDENYKLIKTKTIKPELPIFGGYYSGEKFNYIAFGELNLEENNKKEVIRIVKYDKNFKRVSSVSINGGASYTTVPFDAGSGRMEEHENTLIFHTSRERYTTEDGERHQSQLTIVVDTTNMKVINNLGKFQDNHVSHSFDQYVLFDGEKHVLLDHGDAYPRSVVLNKEGNNGYNEVDLFKIPGDIGANCTGVSIGGFEATTEKYIVAMNTIDHSLVKKYTSFEMVGLDIDQRDIILCIVPKNSINSKVEQITLGKYVGSNKIASIPQMVKLSDESLMVIWQEYLIDKGNAPGNLRYVMIDKNGKQKGRVESISNFRLSDCKPVVFDGKIVWYTNQVNYWDQDYKRNFYSIPLEL